MPGFATPYLYCRAYLATMPVTTCLVRRLARAPGTKNAVDVGLDPHCAKCDQGAAVARWAAEHKIEREGGAMERKKKAKEKGTCANCQREGVVIKARGCCANCYDTPMRKGYKRGSKEWTQCLVEIRARMDPLFQPAQGKEPEKAEGLSPDPGASQAPAQEVLRDRPKGEAPVLEKPFDPAAGRPGAENGLRVEFLSKSESVTSPAGSAEERRDEESKAEFPRYLSLFFDFEESKDRGLYAWLRARAAANRRGVSAEIMSILDSIINQEESRRKMEKDFAEFAARAQTLLAVYLCS